MDVLSLLACIAYLGLCAYQVVKAYREHKYRTLILHMLIEGGLSIYFGIRVFVSLVNDISQPWQGILALILVACFLASRLVELGGGLREFHRYLVQRNERWPGD